MGRRGIHVGNWWESRPLGVWIILKMDLREIGWGGMDCIDLAQDRDEWKSLVNTITNLRVP
jgi:hypothetical protein